MPQYTFHIDPSSAGEPEWIIQTLENDEVAVHAARRLLDAGRARIRVGRGAGEGVEWIGAWEPHSRHAAWRDQDQG